MGFEPTRAEHNGLAVHRLNHSATSSTMITRSQIRALKLFFKIVTLKRVSQMQKNTIILQKVPNKLLMLSNFRSLSFTLERLKFKSWITRHNNGNYFPQLQWLLAFISQVKEYSI